MKLRTGLIGLSASLLLLLVVTPLFAAQTGASPIATAGTAVITAEEIRRHVDALTNDAIGPRTFGSPGLERAAQYVAAQFEQMQLKPAGRTAAAFHDLAFRRAESDTNSWFQRYRLPGKLTPVYEQTSMHFLVRPQRNDHDVVEVSDRIGRRRFGMTPVERTVSVPFENGAYFAVDTIPPSVVKKWGFEKSPVTMTILTGHHTAATASAATAQLDGDVVLYAPPIGIDSAARQQVIDALYDARNVVVLSEEDSVTFARRNAIRRAHPPTVTSKLMVTGPSRWATHVWSGHVADVLATAGLDLRQLQMDSTPAVRKVPSMATWVSTRFQEMESDTTSGVNVVGMLVGTDSVLRREFVVFTAHLDQVKGTGKGADDNASGVAALLTLANAFSQPGARPKRSLVFAITSGTAQDFVGTNHLVSSQSLGYGMPTLLNITLERLGRAPKDSLFVDGTVDLTFTMPPAWVAAQHPELGVTLVEGETAMTKKSEHMAFTWRAVPSLFFYGSASERAGDATDTAEAIDVEQATRMVRLIHYTASAIANGSEWPRWSAEGRMRRLLLLGK